MKNNLFFICAMTTVVGLSNGHADQACETRALKEAIAECLRLCPTACKEPMYWTPDQKSVAECDAACKDFCNITSTDVIAEGTPPIKIEAIQDLMQRKAICEGKPISGSPAWASVDPAAANPAP